MPGGIPSLPQYAIMAWCSVKAEGQLYLFYLGIYLLPNLYLITIHDRVSASFDDIWPLQLSIIVKLSKKQSFSYFLLCVV